jgi:hypothetical protein
MFIYMSTVLASLRVVRVVITFCFGL